MDEISPGFAVDQKREITLSNSNLSINYKIIPSPLYVFVFLRTLNNILP